MKEKFYVGQRVRLVKPTPRYASKLGVCGTISASLHRDAGHRRYGYGVNWDDSPLTHFELPDSIAPIYDGDQKTAWSESTWKPMHLRPLSEPTIQREEREMTA